MSWQPTRSDPRVILGPLACQACQVRVYLAQVEVTDMYGTSYERRIIDQSGKRHRCAVIREPEPVIEYRECAGCGRTLELDDFPLGNPRVDGTRHPMRLCEDCMTERRQTPEQRAENKRLVDRAAWRRRKARPQPG